jgi:hypothetical protein
MAAFDYTDFYILDPYYRKFDSTELVEDDIVRNIIQKYLLIIYTNKGDVMGDQNFGGNLLEVLYETKVNSESVKEIIAAQMTTYIPELTNTPYDLQVIFEQDPENYQDIMFISFSISEYEVVNQVGTFS